MLSLEGCTSVYSHKSLPGLSNPSSETLSRMLKTWQTLEFLQLQISVHSSYYSCLLCTPLRTLHTVPVGGKVSSDHTALHDTELGGQWEKASH